MTITYSSTRIVALTLGVAAVVALALSLAVATPAQAAGICPGTTFSVNLRAGASGTAVMQLQQFLNMDPDTRVALSGVGSPGNETSYFGALTTAAVKKFQQKYAAQILTPLGLSAPTPNFYASSRAEANSLCAGNTNPNPNPNPTPGSATVSAAAQPANSLAPANAARVPFTAFTVTAGGAAVTVNSVTVQRQGPSLDTDVAGVVLINASTGVQLGTARVLDSNHSATIGSPITIPAGTSMTFWVAANIAAAPSSGDIASFAVTAVNTASTVSGSLPITGASNTFNTTALIGSATIQTSSFDPNAASTQPIGTTGYRFTGVRIQAGSQENLTFKSITWYESGSASGIANVMTVVNGTSYPTTVDSTGRYYTSVFPSGIVIPEGQSVDAYVQGDLGVNTVANTYAEFDIYRNTDIYLVGNTYGFGITPTGTGSTAYSSSSSHATLFDTSVSTATPWIQGSTVSVTAGTFSTIQNANSVGAQNIAINVPLQPLGGFQTNLTGEAIQVQSLKVHFTTSANLSSLQNVELVNSSGQVISGPYNATCDANSNVVENNPSTCSSGAQTVTFQGATTFPTGSNTYTIEGQVQTQTGINGVTVVANTNPSSSDWSNVTGQTTGNNIAIGVSNFSMNTMTIKAAALTVGNGSTPTAQAIVAGGSNILFATVQLDASQSGENVRLSSLPLTIVQTGTSPLSSLSNCQVSNGSTVLNTGSYIFNGTSISSLASSTNVTISFNNSLTVPKATVTTLSLNCTLSSSAASGSTFAIGANTSTSAWAVTGVTSGSTVTPVLTSAGSAPLLTVQSGATVAVSTDSSAPAYTIAAGGTTGVTMDAIKFHPSNEAINLQKVGLQVGSASQASDLGNVYVYAGNNIWTTSGVAVAPGTLLGTATFTGNTTTATSTLNQTVQLANNTDATLVIKADLAPIGISQPGTEGDKIVLNYLNSQGTGANSGKTINDATVVTAPSGVTVFKTYPTLALGPSVGNNPNGTNAALKKFSITANSSGPVGLYQIAINVATSSVTLGNLQLHAYTDAGYSQAANVPGNNNGQFGLTNGTGGADTTLTSAPALKFQQSAANALQIGAGQTLYFTLTGNILAIAGSATNWTVTATVQGDTNQIVGGVTDVPAMSSPNFIWSPNATTTATTTSAAAGSGDWTNGFGVAGLPSTGL